MGAFLWLLLYYTALLDTAWATQSTRVTPRCAGSDSITHTRFERCTRRDDSGSHRCNLGVKSSLARGVPSGQNQIFPLRGCIAETYAKVMGSSSPSQPSLKPEYTLSFCSWIEVAGCFSPPIGSTISRRYAAFLAAVSPLQSWIRARGIHGREA